MSEAEQIKKEIMNMAAADIELLFKIIGDLGHVGYRISLCKLRGYSYQQCANKFKIPKSTAQSYFEKCTEMSYDLALKKLFQIK